MNGTFLLLGGGGFTSLDAGTSALDDYLLALTGKEMPRVCFVPTASGDSAEYIDAFMKAFAGKAAPSVLSLFGRDPWKFRDPAMLPEQDAIYVGGGSTANLLALWRLHGVADILAQAAACGVIIAGMSAGMGCWFEASATPSFGPVAPLRDGLGFLAGSVCPHYLARPGRREKFVTWIADGELPDGYGVDDHAALLFRDGELTEAVAERPGHPVYRVRRLSPGQAVETEVSVRLLSTGSSET